MKKYIFFLSLFSILTLYLNAQELVTDRPDQTESAVTVPKGSFQLEAGLTFEQNRVTGITESSLTPATLLRYGVFDWLELRLAGSVDNNWYKHADGINTDLGNVEVGVKFSILNNEDINTKIAFLTHLSIPTGESPISSFKEPYVTINKLAISHDFGDFSFGYNLGFDYFFDYYEDFNKVITYSFAFGYGVNDKIGVYAEVFGGLSRFSELNVSRSIDGGVTYLLKDNMQLDFSAGKNLEYNIYYIGTGFSWRIPK